MESTCKSLLRPDRAFHVLFKILGYTGDDENDWRSHRTRLGFGGDFGARAEQSALRAVSTIGNERAAQGGSAAAHIELLQPIQDARRGGVGPSDP